MKKIIVLICCIFFGSVDVLYSLPLQSRNITVNGYSSELQVPLGMTVEYVANIGRPRAIALGPDGEMLIGSRGATIYRIPYPYSEAEILVTLQGYIHSAAYKEGRIYAAETGAVLAADYQGASTSLTAADFIEVTSLASATGGHSSRTIIAGPDDRLYVGLGISGNCSDEYLDNSYPFETRRGGVFVLDAHDNLQPFSSGLRNPIGLAFHPQTDELYATNAGPDHLGYDMPPEIFSPLAPGSFHGMPWFYYYDGSFREAGCAASTPPRPASQATAPAALFPPRSTPMGLAFLQESSLGREYGGSAVVAVHGSWATSPGGEPESRRPPQLSLVVFENGDAVRVEDLVTGFQRSDGSRFARPAGVAVGEDGHIYFTSDGGEVNGLFRLVPENSGRSISSIYGLLLDNQ